MKRSKVVFVNRGTYPMTLLNDSPAIEEANRIILCDKDGDKLDVDQVILAPGASCFALANEAVSDRITNIVQDS